MRSSPGLPRPCLNHPNHAIRGSMAMPVKVLKLALPPHQSHPHAAGQPREPHKWRKAIHEAAQAKMQARGISYTASDRLAVRVKLYFTKPGLCRMADVVVTHFEASPSQMPRS